MTSHRSNYIVMYAPNRAFFTPQGARLSDGSELLGQNPI